MINNSSSLLLFFLALSVSFSANATRHHFWKFLRGDKEAAYYALSALSEKQNFSGTIKTEDIFQQSLMPDSIVLIFPKEYIPRLPRSNKAIYRSQLVTLLIKAMNKASNLPNTIILFFVDRDISAVIHVITRQLYIFLGDEKYSSIFLLGHQPHTSKQQRRRPQKDVVYNISFRQNLSNEKSLESLTESYIQLFVPPTAQEIMEVD